jgi:hypothetical protein
MATSNAGTINTGNSLANLTISNMAAMANKSGN